MRIHASYAVGWRIMIREDADRDVVVSEVADVQSVVGRLLAEDYSFTIVISPVRISQSARLDGVTEEDITQGSGLAYPLSAYPVEVYDFGGEG